VEHETIIEGVPVVCCPLRGYGFMLTRLEERGMPAKERFEAKIPDKNLVAVD
jgi:hypothetical protein